MLDDAVEVILRSDLFNPGFYRERYFSETETPDSDLAAHYLENGDSGRFKPSADFDSKLYYYFNDDVKVRGMNPLLHYELHGRKEKRKVRGSPFLFDSHHVNGLNAYDCQFHSAMFVELPVRLRDVDIGGRGTTCIGAMSYAESGTRLQSVASVGRFCSIAENCIISGQDLFSDSVSTSPLFSGNLAWANEYRLGDTAFEGKYRSNEGSRIDSTGSGSGQSMITIGNDVWIGRDSKVLGRVDVGDGAVIQPGSVVTSSVDPYTVVGGNPARVIGRRFDDKVIGRLLGIAWWDYGPAITEGLPMDDVDSSIGMMEERIVDGLLPWRPDAVSIDPYKHVITHRV